MMHRGRLMLVVVVQRLLHPLEPFEIQRPHRPCAVVLIKNSLREIQVVLRNHLVSVNLNHHTAGAHDQPAMFLPVQHPGLLRRIVPHHPSHFKGVGIHQAVVAAHHVRAGLFRPAQQLLVIVGGHPVVAVDKAHPLSCSRFQSRVFRSALAPVHLVGQHPQFTGIFFGILPQYFRRLVRGGIVHRQDFIIRYGLVYQAVQAELQPALCRHIVHRHNHAQFHSSSPPLSTSALPSCTRYTRSHFSMV